MLGMIFRAASDLAGAQHPLPPSWRNVDIVIKWLHQNYDRNVTIGEMSKLAGLSSAHFCKAFKEYAGVSPHKYLLRIKIEKAREILYNVDINCTAVAKKVGFSTLASFSRSFAEMVGLSPMNWIKEHGAALTPERRRLE